MKILDTYKEHQLSEDNQGNFTVKSGPFLYVTRDYESAIEWYIKLQNKGAK